MQKLITFLLKKKIETATGTITETSKTKIFMSIAALLKAVEIASPYFSHPIVVPGHVYEMLYALAGISYVERSIK